MCGALGIAASPEALRERALGLSAVEVEEMVTAAGGVAVAVRSEAEWAAHPHGSRVGSLPLVVQEGRSEGAGRPVDGARVLDLTRVIAGPVATRTLALWGADVLRVDPPLLPEIEWQHLDTGAGKRSCVLDVRSERFAELAAEADVLVHGYRPGALQIGRASCRERVCSTV